MTTTVLANAAVPTRRIKDALGDIQTPLQHVPKLKSTYRGSLAEMIACCTIAEGIIQHAIGYEEFEKRIAGTRASPKGPSYSPFMLRDGIPHEEGFFKCQRERLMCDGDDIGEGRKVRLTKLDGGL